MTTLESVKLTGTKPEPIRTVVCNLCGADDFTVVFEAGVAQPSRIVRCNQCDLMYSNPRVVLPNYDNLQKSRLTEDSYLTTNRFRLLKELRQIRDYRNTRAHLREAYPQRGKLVEIGCGTASLLKCFREDGWQVEGIEPWGEACEYAARNYGIKSHCGTIEEVSLPDESVDVVVMLHVIEHMFDPILNIARIFRMLKPGGTLVLETPRDDSLMFALWGRRERSISCDEHIYFFTSKTLPRMCAKVGFELQRMMFVGRSLSVDRLAWNVGVMSKSKLIQSAIARVGSVLQFHRLWLYLNVRDMQRAYFRKPSPA